MIRDARPDDVKRILELGERFFNEAGWPRVASWDRNSVIDTLEKLATDGVLLVADEGGNVVGIAGAPVGPAYFNSAINMSQELFWYVDDPKGAGRGIGMPMLDALEAGCKAKGSHVHIQGAVAGLRDATLDRVYRTRGYTPAERYYIKRLP